MERGASSQGCCVLVPRVPWLLGVLSAVKWPQTPSHLDPKPSPGCGSRRPQAEQSRGSARPSDVEGWPDVAATGEVTEINALPNEGAGPPDDFQAMLGPWNLHLATLPLV